MTGSVEGLLACLARRGIWVCRVGDRLRLAPAGAVTPEDLAEVRRFKPDLLAIVSTEEPPIPPPDTRTPADVQAAVEAVLGACELVETLPRLVADVRWKMLLDATQPTRRRK